jgi:hypothetical protein
VVHVLAVVAVVGRPLLIAVRGIIGAVEVEHQPVGSAVPLSLAQVGLDEGFGEAIAAVSVHRVFQAREGRLAGQIVGIGLRQTPAQQLEQRVAAQGVGVVLVFVA